MRPTLALVTCSRWLHRALASGGKAPSYSSKAAIAADHRWYPWVTFQDHLST